MSPGERIRDALARLGPDLAACAGLALAALALSWRIVAAPRLVEGRVSTGAWDGPILGVFLLISVLTYLFARQALGARFPALVAALTFTGGGYLASYPALDRSILGTVAGLPLILGAVELGARRGWLWFIAAGAVWGLAVSLGDPQTALYVGYLALAYGAFQTWQRKAIWWRGLGRLALALAVGLLVAGAMWLLGWGGAHPALRTAEGYQQASGDLAPRALLQLILPSALGPLSPLYVGILPLLLALAGLLIGVGWEARFWGAAALIALLLALGGKAALYPLAYLAAPGFGSFHSQERAALVASFALALLAGHGAQALSRSLSPSSMGRLRGLARWAGLLGLGMLTLTAVLPVGGAVQGLLLLGGVGLLTLRLGRGANRRQAMPGQAVTGPLAHTRGFRRRSAQRWLQRGVFAPFRRRGRRLVAEEGRRAWLWWGLAVALILADLGLARWGSSLHYGPRADLGGQVAFLGYELEAPQVEPRGTVKLTLYWQALSPTEVDYTVFTHLLDAEDRIRGQQDRMPMGGMRPTTTWLPGEIVVDLYTIPVAPDAPPGIYVIEVGMYDLATGARLPVLGPDGVRVPQDRILLGMVDVGP
ncbi:MAG: hypothetical protein ACE5MB_07105 [Anaerolineae bacterium]